MIHATPDGEPLERLSPSTQGLSVALADNALTELTLQLHEGRVSWSEWSARNHHIDRLLDTRSPVFPDASELAEMSWGTPKPTPDQPVSRDEKMRLIWDLLKKAKSAHDLTAGPEFVAPDGETYTLANSHQLTDAVAAGFRATWQQMIGSLQAQIVGYHPTQDHIAELLFKAHFGGNPDEAHLRIRHDAYVRTMARFAHLALAKKKPYNPTADARRGDPFDLEMTLALALPALVCTLDKRFRKHLELAGTHQVRQLVTPAELLAGARNGDLADRFSWATSQ